MKEKIETVTYRCDICGAEDITPQTLRHSETFGYRPVEPFGVVVVLKAFGSYCEHICEVCANKAMAAAFSAEFERTKEVTNHAGHVCPACGNPYPRAPASLLCDNCGKSMAEHNKMGQCPSKDAK